MDSTPSAHTWDVSSHGLPPTTSSCAHATDLNTPPMDPLFVDPLLFLSLLPTVILPTMERSFSRLGPRKISVPERRDGGTKLLLMMSLCQR